MFRQSVRLSRSASVSPNSGRAIKRALFFGAGLINTGIDIVGGLIIGVAQRSLSFGEAGQAYALLSIGDGFVAQFPTLLISTSRRRRLWKR